MRIGIFGGSFNPVHSGHVGIARRAIDELSLDRLLVVPAKVSPFKTDAAALLLPDETRLLLVRAAFNGVAKASVDERELRRGGVSYAIDTVREIAAENPDAELVFLVGEDSVAGLTHWKDIDALRGLCAFRSFPRTRESSTEIRERLARGESVEGLVPPAVELFLRHRVTYNDDARIAAAVLAGLERKDGYCPCRIPKLPEFFCPCEEFRSQLADDTFEGLCHCRLYRKQ